MNEDGKNEVLTSGPTADTATEPQNTVVSEDPTEKANTATDRTFTRDEVTKILKKRLERNNKKFWARLGIEGEDKLDEYLESHNKAIKDLEESNAKYGELDSKYKQVFHDYLYLKSGIIPERYGDLDKYFENGELTEESLANVLKSHPDFVKPKQTIPQQIGMEQNGQQNRETEKELAEKLLGVKL